MDLTPRWFSDWIKHGFCPKDGSALHGEVRYAAVRTSHPALTQARFAIGQDRSSHDLILIGITSVGAPPSLRETQLFVHWLLAELRVYLVCEWCQESDNVVHRYSPHYSGRGDLIGTCTSCLRRRRVNVFWTLDVETKPAPVVTTDEVLDAYELLKGIDRLSDLLNAAGP